LRKYESKEIQRAKLKELVGTSKISCSAKFTKGRKYDGSLEGLRLLLDVTIYLKEGKRLHLHHLWIKNKPEYYSRYESKTLDFTAEVVNYGIEGKVCLTNVYIKKYVRKGIKG
jgi:hypothetical protein